MTTSVLWTLLPNGLDDSGTVAHLSLVASPRTAAAVTKLPADSDLARWPTFVANLLDRLTVVVAGSSERIPVRVTSPRPDQALWDRLVPHGRTRATPFDGSVGTPILIETETAYSMKPAVTALESLYTQAAASERSLSRQDHPSHQMIEGLRAWLNQPETDNSAVALATRAAASAVRAAAITDLLNPQRITAARVEQAAALLREQGHLAAAAAAPIVPILNRLRVARSATNPQGEPITTPGILTAIPASDNAELHQLIGLFLDHPALALRLGLRVDLDIPVFTGQRLIRIGNANGAPLDGPVPIPQPWSAVVCNPAQRRFTMATQPDVTSVEIIEGLFDLRSSPTGHQYVVTDIDPVGVAEQMATLAGAPANANATAALPVRRDIGIVVAQVDRRTRALTHRLQRQARFDSGKGVSEVEGAPVLFADDVTKGYRIDVAQNSGEFRSLMRRIVTYSLSAPTKTPPTVIATVTDEGYSEPFTPVEQRDDQSTPHVFIGEEVCRWQGWSLAAHPPGPVVGAEPGGAQVTVPDRRPFPNLPLLIDTVVEPGTLTRLRYGSSYRFQARAVDLAGNSLPVSEAQGKMATEPFRFLRHEPVPSPALVPRRPFTPGESLLRLIVRTDGDGQVMGTTCERHIAPPKSSQQQAEHHGMFDAAFGPNVPVAERNRILALAKREAGTFLDPTVIDPGGAPVKANGIRVATNVGAPPPQTTLPIPRGEVLPAGEYIIHDTDNAILPYLPDVVSAGSAWVGLPNTASPAGASPIVVPWGTQPWPDVPPHRLVLRAGTTAQTQVLTPTGATGRPVLEVTLPPATEIQVQLSSALTSTGLDVLDPIAPALRKAALAGQNPLFSPAQTLTLVHVVRKPIQAPTLTLKRLLDQSFDDDRPRGSTWARLHGTVTAHAPSSAKVDVVGTWTEIIDRGFGPVLFEPRRSVAGSVAIDLTDTGSLPFEAIHEVGDTKRRIITYRPVATTRFREYFIGLEDGDDALVRAGEPVVVDIPSARRPEPPRIHSVIPLLRHTRSVSNGQLTSTRSCTGFRIYLKRPWFTSGEGERLGVSVATTAEFGDNLAKFDALRDLVSRWGSDPYETSAPGSAPHLLPEMILNAKERQDSAQIPDNPEGSLGHTVVGLEVNFEAERDLWFADLELDLKSSKLNLARLPMLRLALVRFQPGTLEFSPECSTLVHTDFVTLLPSRTLNVSKKLNGDRLELSMNVTGARLTQIEACWQRRMLDPLNKKATDIYVDATDVPVANFLISGPPFVPNPSGNPTSGPLPPDHPHSGNGTLSSGNVSGTPRQELLAGRVVVREQEPTWSLVRPAGGERTVWFDTFDIEELG